jgi:hypothetical protein
MVLDPLPELWVGCALLTLPWRVPWLLAALYADGPLVIMRLLPLPAEY